MGYRNKIALLEKSKREEIKEMTHEQLVKWFKKTGSGDVLDPDDDYVPCYELANEFYELGKYCDLEYLNEVKMPVFLNTETNNNFNSDGEFVLIEKAGLLLIIEEYRKKILKYYESILTPPQHDIDLNCVETADMVIRSKIKEWTSEFIKPYNLNMTDPDIVDSWSYEYTIFELVRHLKTFDFEKYHVCLTGW